MPHFLSGRRRADGAERRCGIERLEGRRLLSVVTVDTLTDTHAMDSISSPLDATGHVSLRSAIENFNDDLRGDSEPTVIQFAVGAANPKITVGSSGLGPLPFVLANINGFGITINGNSGGATRVVLDGTMAGAGATGLTFLGAKATIEGLVIDHFAGDGIDITGESPMPGEGGHVIRNNFIGTDPTGMMAAANGGAGIRVRGGTPGNTIGGPNAADRNVISGNGGDGIQIDPLAAGMSLPAGSTGDVIASNYIGTNSTATAAVPNGGTGVSIAGDEAASSAGTLPSTVGPANVISGNDADGILIQGFFAQGGIQVVGNSIGTDSPGNVAIPNVANGVHITDSPNNTVGAAGDQGNVISGNEGSGVLITLAQSTGNVVQNNAIGANTAGTAALPNQLDGVQISLGAAGNTVGGSTAGLGNLISGNGRAGVSIQGASATRVQNNLIGPNRTRTAALGNGAQGVSVADGAQQCIIRDNAIEGNEGDGVFISGSSDNSILSNFIGSARASNGADGIHLADGADTNVVSLNSIGNNSADGIAISMSDDNTITANNVIGNNGAGVSIQGGSSNAVGGSIAAARNVISGNFGPGVSLSGGALNTIMGDYIGVDATGMVASPNGVPASPQPGVLIDNAQGTTVTGNVISANTGAGVRVTGDAALGNSVRTNQIGGSAGEALLNGALGIDLGPAGVTPITPGGPHAGPNHLQNFPVLTYAAQSASGTLVTGTLNSAPNSDFTIDFYSNTVADPSGYGQGQTYLGMTVVHTDAAGNASFSFNTALIVPWRQFISATATSASNDTSEFSHVFQVQVLGDVNGDGSVGFDDLVALARNYGKAGTFAQGDFNGDGSIGFDDLVILARNYGRMASSAVRTAAPLLVIARRGHTM